MELAHDLRGAAARGELSVHPVLRNSSTHKTPAIKRWLLAHPRFELHFIPTSSSWLNPVERWFGELTSKKLRRGTHRSVRELNTDIRDWIETCTKTADQILDSIAATANGSNGSRQQRAGRQVSDQCSMSKTNVWKSVHTRRPVEKV